MLRPRHRFPARFSDHFSDHFSCRGRGIREEGRQVREARREVSARGRAGTKAGRAPGNPGGRPPGIFSASFAICSGLGMPPPPSPSMLARPAIGPRLAPPIAFITSAMVRCIFRSLLMSSGLVPEPAAMRRLRLALSTIGIAPLLRRHRIDDRHLPLEHLFVEIAFGELILDLGDAGQHRHQPAHAAHILHLRELLAQIGEIERAAAHFLGDARRLFGVDGGAGLFDQRDDVAHAEDAAGDAGRIEILDGVEFFAGADQLDRLAGDRAHRQRRAAAAVAVDAGEHDAGEADALVEAAGEIDGVLAGQRVGDQQHFVRGRGAPHFRRFVHHRFVERDAAGGVEQHDVVAAEPSRLQRAVGDLHRRLAGDDRQRIDADLLAEHGELLHAPPGGGCRATPSAPCVWRTSVRRLATFAVVVVLPEPCRPTIMMATGAGALRSIGCAPAIPASRSAGRARSSRPSGRA